VIAFVHGVVTFTAIAVRFSGGMARFDHPEAGLGFLERVCEVLADVLAQPGAMLWGRLPVPSSSLKQWAVFVLNSLIWGAGISSVICFLIVRKAGGHVGER